MYKKVASPSTDTTSDTEAIFEVLNLWAETDTCLSNNLSPSLQRDESFTYQTIYLVFDNSKPLTLSASKVFASYLMMHSKTLPIEYHKIVKLFQ